jgi:hypothetical protein
MLSEKEIMKIIKGCDNALIILQKGENVQCSGTNWIELGLVINQVMSESPEITRAFTAAVHAYHCQHPKEKKVWDEVTQAVDKLKEALEDEE